MAAEFSLLAEFDELRDIALEGIDPRLRLLTAHQVTNLLEIGPEALSCPARRRRMDLPAVRVGRAMQFRMVDVARVIARGLEFSPDETPGERSRDANPGERPLEGLTE